MKHAKAVFVAFICAVAILFCIAVYGHDYNGNYISWGVDEFELFGLTQIELTQQFKNKLTFDWVNSRAYVGGSSSASRQFVLTFKDRRVCEVQRLLKDGAGCNLMGYSFTSKEAALRFCIEGLSDYGKLKPEEEKKLSSAKKMIIELEGTKNGSGKEKSK